MDSGFVSTIRMPTIRKNYFQLNRRLCSANCKPRLGSAGSCCAFPSLPGREGGETKRLEFCLASTSGEGPRCSLIIGAVHALGLKKTPRPLVLLRLQFNSVSVQVEKREANSLGTLEYHGWSAVAAARRVCGCVSAVVRRGAVQAKALFRTAGRKAHVLRPALQKVGGDGGRQLETLRGGGVRQVAPVRQRGETWVVGVRRAGRLGGALIAAVLCCTGEEEPRFALWWWWCRCSRHGCCCSWLLLWQDVTLSIGLLGTRNLASFFSLGGENQARSSPPIL